MNPPPLARPAFRVHLEAATLRQRVVAGIVTAIICAIGVLVFLLDPVTAPYAPKCILYWSTGLYCPGCGTGRALHALFTGQFRQAWAWNPLMVLLFPVLLGFIGEQVLRVTAGRRVMTDSFPVRLGWALAAIVIAHGILRNVPLAVFDWMRPHGL